MVIYLKNKRINNAIIFPPSPICIFTLINKTIESFLMLFNILETILQKRFAFLHIYKIYVHNIKSLYLLDTLLCLKREEEAHRKKKTFSQQKQCHLNLNK